MMGEIADQHVEAWAAGLDPNEMDGSDWADFWGDRGKPIFESDAAAAESFIDEMQWRMERLCMDRGQPGDTLATIMRRLFPQLSQGQTDSFVAMLEAIGGLPDDDD